MKRFPLLVSLFLGACSMAPQKGYAPAENRAVKKDISAMETRSLGSAEFKAKRGNSFAPKIAGAQPLSLAMASDSYAEPESQAASPVLNNPDNSLFYQGWIRSEHKNPDSLLNLAEDMAKHWGGASQNRSMGHLSLQIPPAYFDSLYVGLQKLGPVLSKNRTAVNLGDEIQSNDMSRKICQKSLARIQQILAAAKSDEERIRLLKEMQRLRNQLEALEGRSRTLAAMVQMSQLDYDVAELKEEINPLPQSELKSMLWLYPWTHGQEIDTEDWSDHFYPFKAPKLAPEFLVRLSPAKAGLHKWTSATGSRIDWIQRANNPRGDLDFWQKLLSSKSSTQGLWEKWGNWSALRIPAKSPRDPQEIYLLKVHGKKMNLVRLRIESAKAAQILPVIMKNFQDLAP